MKKIYQTPTINIVMLQTQHQMLADSVAYGETTTATSGNLSRGGSFWDDEEDYDE